MSRKRKSTKKRPYIRKAFESAKPGEKSESGADTSANIYRSMLLSDVWKSLTPRQVRLYLICKSEYYGKSKDDLRPFKEYFDSHHISDQERLRHFTMNWGKVRKDGLFGMYSNHNHFIDDMNVLISKGFVDCIIPGADTRQKNLYRLSDRWTRYGTDEYELPDNCKTISGRGTRRRHNTTYPADA